MGLFRIIAIFLLIYFAVRVLGRLLMPLMGNKQGTKTNYSRKEPDNRKEGEVRVEYTDPEKAKRKKDSGEGEYIDFEELD